VNDQDLTISADSTKTAWETPSVFELPMEETQGLLEISRFVKLELPVTG
jgi:hypothetical protein